ncbi:MAG: VanZ family protein [Myxococcota bacterium]
MPLDDWLLSVLPGAGTSAGTDALMIVASTAGLLSLALGVPWWLGRHDRSLSRTAGGTMLVGLGLTLVLQLLVQRPRPIDTELLLPLPPLPAFPSGHAVLASIAVVMLIAHRWRWGVALVPIAALVAVSRVYVGHHYPSDVIGGVIVGVGLALGAVARARAAPDDPWRLRWLLWPQLGLVLAISLVAYTGVFAGGRTAWLALPGMDKALHFLMFGLLALGTCLATRDRALTVGPCPIPLAVLLPLLGALTEELIQAMSPHRTADPLDLLADLLGMLVFWQLGRRLATRRC